MEGIVYDRWNKTRRGKAKGMYDLGECAEKIEPLSYEKHRVDNHIDVLSGSFSFGCSDWISVSA
jgi:hypothetical protein